MLELQGAAGFSKPQKSIILKRFSAHSNKPIRPHFPLSFQQIRTTSLLGDPPSHFGGTFNTIDECEVLQNSIKVGCNTRLKGVGNLPHKTDLKLYFELGLKG